MAEEKVKDQPIMPIRGPLAHSEASVALEWHGPTMARVGHTTEYNLIVRNISTGPVQETLVRVRIPQGLSVVSTEPRSLSEGNVHAWELGTLMAKQEKTITLRLLADGRGEMTPQAWVTFTGLSVAKIQANEPRLVIKATAPEKVLVGDTATITFMVRNGGDGPAEQVHFQAMLSEGLEHPRQPRGLRRG